MEEGSGDIVRPDAEVIPPPLPRCKHDGSVRHACACRSLLAAPHPGARAV